MQYKHGRFLRHYRSQTTPPSVEKQLAWLAKRERKAEHKTRTWRNAQRHATNFTPRYGPFDPLMLELKRGIEHSEAYAVYGPRPLAG